MTDSIYTRRDFVRAGAVAALAMFGGTLLTACAPSQTVTPVSPTGTGTGSTGASGSPTEPGTGTSTPSKPQPPDILSKFEMPRYPGSEAIDKFAFKWPGIEQYLANANAEWSYYSSNDAPTKVSTFFREQTQKAPFLKRELLFYDGGADGIISVFVDDSLKVFIRVWAIPQPGDSSKSNIAVAVEDTFRVYQET